MKIKMWLRLEDHCGCDLVAVVYENGLNAYLTTEEFETAVEVGDVDQAH